MRDSLQKLTHARNCFESLCKEFSLSGKKLTISAVATKANVDRKYFYGRINTPDDDLRHLWKTLGEEIKNFNQSIDVLSKSKAQAFHSVDCKLQNALVENYGLVEAANQLKAIKSRLELQLVQAREKIDILEDRIRLLEVRLFSLPSDSGPIIAFNNRAVIVSPDRLAEGTDELDRTRAWVNAIKELKSVLGRPVEKNLYLTIGVPGSGKSTWCSNIQVSNRLSVVLDACNLTKSDRYEVLDFASSNKNTKCIAVVFHVSLETALKRNSGRKKADRVPDDKIVMMHESIEYPRLFDDLELFDEIIMVRS